MLVTFSALHEAKRDGTLAQTLAAMTPAERVEAARVCAANSTRTVSEWLTTFGELVEADDAVYCEECGVAVNPALAVLDGELMVCLGCGPCSAAEFEVMQMAEAERLMAAEAEDAARFASEDAAYGAYVEEHGHDPAAWPAPETFASDPEAWVAVSEAPCGPVTATCNVCGSDGSPCVECNPIERSSVWQGEKSDAATKLAELKTSVEDRLAFAAAPAPAGAVESISRAALFDSLCSSVDELRDYWRDVPRRLKAINEAWEFVLLAEAFYFNAQGDLLVESSSRPGTYYAVGHSCPCTAGRWGNHCRHSIVGDILGRAVRLMKLQKVA